MNKDIKLVGSNKCPLCGKVFEPIPPLRPNVEDREFYGGRIKFFKEVECDCASDYDLCIEQRYNSQKEDMELRVVDMIVLNRGISPDEFKHIKNLTKDPEIEEIDTSPNVLAAVLDEDTKKKAMELLTPNELRKMGKNIGIKFPVPCQKKDMIERLLKEDPTLVVADPKG